MSAQPVDTTPTLADYEQSVRWARERAHAGDETLEICPHCMCEVDVDPQPHRPGCAGIGMPRATSVPVLANVAPPARPRALRDDGADALARMDAGERQEPVLEEREPTAREETGASGSPPAADHGLQPAAAVGAESGRQRGDAEPASRSSSTRGWSRGKRWDEETVIAAIVRWHAEHGAPPTSAQWLNAADGYPSQSSVKKVFGSWAAGIEAAGFPRPTRRTRPEHGSCHSGFRRRKRGRESGRGDIDTGYRLVARLLLIDADTLDAIGSEVLPSPRARLADVASGLRAIGEWLRSTQENAG